MSSERCKVWYCLKVLSHIKMFVENKIVTWKMKREYLVVQSQLWETLTVHNPYQWCLFLCCMNEKNKGCQLASWISLVTNSKQVGIIPAIPLPAYWLSAQRASKTRLLANTTCLFHTHSLSNLDFSKDKPSTNYLFPLVWFPIPALKRCNLTKPVRAFRYLRFFG